MYPFCAILFEVHPTSNRVFEKNFNYLTFAQVIFEFTKSVKIRCVENFKIEGGEKFPRI